MKYKITTDTAMDKGRREIQQDAVCMLEHGRRGFLAVLSYGIGGMEGGEIFSGIATDEMKKSFETGNVSGDL
jgi:serine/threonine protein phosphatase PrpC